MHEDGWASGRGVLITGGAGDLGRAMAAAFLARGARVTLLDRLPRAQATDVLAGLEPHGALRYVECDVREARDLADALAAVDPLDFVVANAGIVQAQPFLEITPEVWREHLDINLTGCFLTSQAAARLMVARRRPGTLVLTGSWVQEVAWPEIAAYSASKAGIRMLARSMARELAEHGIRVNVIAPGIVDAGLAGQQLRSDPGYAARVRRALAVQELQTPEDIAEGVLFLCSPGADQMTGAVLLLDGGLSLPKF